MRSLSNPILIPERFTTSCYTNGTFYKISFVTLSHFLPPSLVPKCFNDGTFSCENKWICNSSQGRSSGKIINHASGSSVFCYILLYLLLSPKSLHNAPRHKTALSSLFSQKEHKMARSKHINTKPEIFRDFYIICFF